MAFKMNQISCDLASYPYYMLLSPRKFGKTTWWRNLVVAAWGNASKGLLISCGTESGFHHLDNLQVEEALTWDDDYDEETGHRGLVQIVDDLIENNVDYGIKGVCFDTFDTLFDIATDEVMRESRRETGKSCKSINDAFGGYNRGSDRLIKIINDQLSRIRNSIWPKMQGAANSKYGGDNFPAPDAALTKQVLTNLPSVIGMTIDQATKTLETAGFSVIVGDAVDGVESAGTVIQQVPGAGRTAAGATVTIRPSNGQGVAVPAVSGKPADAVQALRSAGFGLVESSCTQKDDASDDGTVTGTDPAAGTIVNRGTQITVQYQAKNCGGPR